MIGVCMDSLSVKFTKTLMPKQCEPSRRHANAVKKMIDALKNGEPHSDYIFRDVLNSDGLNVSDVLEYDPRLLVYAFENLSSKNTGSVNLFPYLMQQLLLADKGKGKMATAYNKLKGEKPNFHDLVEPSFYDFLTQPTPEVCEILCQDELLFNHSLRFFEKAQFKGYKTLTAYVDTTRRGFKVAEYLLKVSAHDNQLNTPLFRRNLCKKLMPEKSRPSAHHASLNEALTLHSGEVPCIALLNLYRAMHDQDPVPWGSMAKKGYEFMIDNVDFKKITHLEVRSLLIRMELENLISHKFKKMTILSELQL